ncbi:MAG TPA: hypothetical protein VH814_23870 [Steroidobacteraceae bacterium]|jgi:hypothetical protein
MHRIAQVVQQLANELSLIFLLDPVQDFRIGRRRGGKTRVQILFSVCDQGWELLHGLVSSPTHLKKLPLHAR